jgi:hypothetical protein
VSSAVNVHSLAHRLLQTPAGCGTILLIVGDCAVKLGLSAVVVAILTSSICDPAQAANWKSSVTKDGRIVVSISGEIIEGDLEAFKAAVKAANDAGKLVTSIRLNSIGGNLLEGANVGKARLARRLAS